LSGRIPAKNAQDLARVVDKISRYEPLSSRSALFIDAVKDAVPVFNSARFLKHISLGLQRKWKVHEVREGRDECKPATIVEKLNGGGYSLVVGMTHGILFGIVIDSVKRMRVVDRHLEEIKHEENIILMCEEIEKAGWYEESLKPAILDTRDVRNLKNGVPFFFFGFGCYIAALDYRSGYSIVEQFVMQKRGAIAACGLSRDISEVTRDDYHAALERKGGLHFEIGESVILNLCNHRMSFGEALARAIEEYSLSHPELIKDLDQKRVLFGLTLIGDPTLRLMR